MSWWRSLGIRRKLILVIQLISSVALLVACAAFMLYVWIAMRRAMAEDLTVLANVLANNSTAALTFGDGASGRESLQPLRARPHILRADLYDKNGQYFASYVGEDGDPLAPPPPPGPDGERFEGDSLKIVRPVVLNNKRLGTLSIQSDLQPLYERLQLYGTGVIVALLIAILISYVLTAFLQRAVSEPMLDLARTAQQVTESRNYSLRVQPRSDDEIGRLGAGFNQMLDGIQQREAALQREITERRRAEDEVRRHRDHLEELVQERTSALQDANERLKQASAALARSNAELEQFAYVASHDLREPLRTITGFVQLLQQHLEDKLTETDRRYMNFVTGGARRMDALITDLLQYARLETRAQPFQPADCETILDTVLENLRAMIHETRAKISYDRPLPVVHGDITQLTQILQNLIGNGIKFRHPEEPPKIHVAVHRQAGEWVFSVQDNGIGIDPQYHKRIFIIFERLHPQDQYPGTGIGLAVCRKIVERHGGRIWVESAPGKGSTFYFTIPASEPAA